MCEERAAALVGDAHPWFLGKERIDLTPVVVDGRARQSAATDNLAFGVLRACGQLGCLVPERLALVGFDNVAFGEIALTPLTSVDGSGFNIGRRAMRLLVDRIENGSDPTVKYSPVQMVIQPTLCIRRSCGCRPGAEVS